MNVRGFFRNLSPQRAGQRNSYVISRGKAQVNKDLLGHGVNTGRLLSSNWELAQSPWGLFFGVDMVRDRPRGVRLAKEERRLPSGKPLCGVWTKLRRVSFLEVQGLVHNTRGVRSALHPQCSSPSGGQGQARGLHSPRESSLTPGSLRTLGCNTHTHFCCLASGAPLALFHPLPLPCPSPW